MPHGVVGNMLRRVLVILAVLALTPLSTAIINRDNQLANASFEEDADGDKFPDHWTTPAPQRTNTVACEFERTNDSHSGEWALLVRAPANGNCGLASDPIPVIPGLVYEARLWTKVTRGAGTPIVWVNFYDANGQMLQAPIFGRSPSAHTYAEGSMISVAPPTAVEARLRVDFAFGGWDILYVDTATLRVV